MATMIAAEMLLCISSGTYSYMRKMETYGFLKRLVSEMQSSFSGSLFLFIIVKLDC